MKHLRLFEGYEEDLFEAKKSFNRKKVKVRDYPDPSKEIYMYGKSKTSKYRIKE